MVPPPLEEDALEPDVEVELPPVDVELALLVDVELVEEAVAPLEVIELLLDGELELEVLVLPPVLDVAPFDEEHPKKMLAVVIAKLRRARVIFTSGA